MILGVSGWLAFRLLGPHHPAEIAVRDDSAGPDGGDSTKSQALSATVVAADAGASAPPDTAIPSMHPLTDALCPPGMAWVEGEYCPTGGAGIFGCKVSVREMGFCIDRHEYPNQIGVYPAVMLLFDESVRLCRAEGKRLCTESEWTHACRQTVSIARCNFGPTTSAGRHSTLRHGSTGIIEAEVIGRRRSAVSTCVSPFGVFDLPGNVQEWVASEHPSGYQAAQKGGSYSQSQIDCERTVQSRQVYSRLPNTGSRCCRDPLVRVPTRR